MKILHSQNNKHNKPKKYTYIQNLYFIIGISYYKSKNIYLNEINDILKYSMQF